VATIITAGEATTDNRVQRGPTQKQQEDSRTAQKSITFQYNTTQLYYLALVFSWLYQTSSFLVEKNMASIYNNL